MPSDKRDTAQVTRSGTEIDATCSRCNKDGTGTYRTEAKCGNCGWEGAALHSLGHEKRDRVEKCPRCETKATYMGEWLDD